MSKGQTFDEMFPLGVCWICKEPCDQAARAHYECSVTICDEWQRRKRIEDQ